MNMNKLLLPLIALSILMIGCKKQMSLKDKAKLTTEKFIEYIKTNKTDSAISLYPDCASFIQSIKMGNVSIVSAETYDSVHYIVTCNDSHMDENYKLVNTSIRFNVVTTLYKDKDIQEIIDSNGLYPIQPTALAVFLRKTGALFETEEDANLAKDFNIYVDFANSYIQKTNLSIEELAEQTYTGNEYNSWAWDNPLTGARPKIEVK